MFGRTSLTDEQKARAEAMRKARDTLKRDGREPTAEMLLLFTQFILYGEARRINWNWVGTGPVGEQVDDDDDLDDENERNEQINYIDRLLHEENYEELAKYVAKLRVDADDPFEGGPSPM